MLHRMRDQRGAHPGCFNYKDGTVILLRDPTIARISDGFGLVDAGGLGEVFRVIEPSMKDRCARA